MMREESWMRLSERRSEGIRAVSTGRNFPAVPPQGQSGGRLVREFVFDSLYAPGKGYFQRDQDVVGSVTDFKSMPGAATCPCSLSDKSEALLVAGGSAAGMNFNEMLSETEYRVKVQSLYDQGGSAWLTPSELFHPFYAQSVARHFLESLRASKALGAPGRKFHVIEIGGGNGTFALGFLDYVKSSDRSVYDRMK